MADEPSIEEMPAFPWASLAPYLSVVILRCIADDPRHSYGAVHRHLMRGPRESPNKTRRIVVADEVVSTLDETFAGIGTLEEIGLDQVAGFVRRTHSSPGWADDTSEFVDTSHELCLMLRRGDLLALRLEDGAVGRLQRWLDKPPFPNVQRIAPIVLGYTFLMGETRGLWLQGAHSRSTRRPDTKNSVGLDLRDAIDPFDDSSYSLGSARSQMPASPDVVQLQGAIGATMNTSQIWFKQMADLSSFLAAVVEVITLIEDATKDESRIVEAFPQLARVVTDLTEVYGAYEVVPVDLDMLPAAASMGDEVRDASALLQEAVLAVRGGSETARFQLDVGLDGSETGTLTVRPAPIPHGFKLEFGFSGEPHVLEPTRRVMDALDAGDLLAVYYESGHVYSRGRISARNTYIAAFPKWDFGDFGERDIEMEKPFNLKSAKEIHRRVGKDGDISLFGWVVEKYKDGWLICDDGSGETADFLQISAEGILRIIHVKGAESRSKNRVVSARSYEAVASQASKNLVYIDKGRLLERLSSPPTATPACWTDGERVDDRSDFLDMLPVSTEVEVVIVQPHLNKPVYDRVRLEDPEDRPSQDLLRLRLLETLLNSARASIVKSGAELVVVGSEFP